MSNRTVGFLGVAATMLIAASVAYLTVFYPIESDVCPFSPKSFTTNVSCDAQCASICPLDPSWSGWSPRLPTDQRERTRAQIIIIRHDKCISACDTQIRTLRSAN
jgi:hypothetical protein